MHSREMTRCPPQTGIAGCVCKALALGLRAALRRRSWVIAALCCSALFAFAQNQVSEYDVKAAYLFNFGKFVRFAPSDGVNNRHTFDICIVGEDPFGHTLDELAANEQLDNKPARVLRLKTAAEARDCGIVYVSASEGSRIGADLEALRGRAILTVSDEADFLKHGGMIQFVNVANHVRFAVNLDGVQSAKLGLSSELLRVALSVNGTPPVAVRP